MKYQNVLKNHILFILALISLRSFSQSIASYNIVFESVWESVADNPTDGISTIDLPENAHWSPLVGATHKTANEFLEMGVSASSGIESVAETGATGTFQSEVTTNTDADQFLNGGGLATAKGTITISNLVISEDFPLVSLATMIAPSPDWFVGINSMNLRSGNSAVNNGWKDTFTIDVFPYDAGTEDGSGYSGSNAASNPIGVITSRVNTTPFNNKKIGTITFTYNSSTLGLKKSNALENIKIFPNPSHGKITISNIQNKNLSAIEVYNVLGRLVKQLPIRKGVSKLNLNFISFNKGIYLLKLKTTKGDSKTLKLIIK